MAEHCLNMVAGTQPDQELRRVQHRRNGAAEWLRLADEIRRPHKSWSNTPLKVWCAKVDRWYKCAPQ